MRARSRPKATISERLVRVVAAEAAKRGVLAKKLRARAVREVEEARGIRCSGDTEVPMGNAIRLKSTEPGRNGRDVAVGRKRVDDLRLASRVGSEAMSFSRKDLV